MSILRLAATAVILAALCVAAPINVALTGTATQSSTYPGGPASNAIDNNPNGNWDFSGLSNSISHTNLEVNAWWRVDFSAAPITGIELYNRVDNGSSTRINPFSVSLYNGNVEVWHALAQNMGTSLSFTLPGIMATGVEVELDGENYLHLAEVRVLSSPVPEPSTYALMAGGLALLGMLRHRKS